MTGLLPFDIVPTTLAEVLVTTLSIYFGFCVQNVMISSTTSALQSIDARRVIGQHSIPTSYILHPAFYILLPTSYILHPTSCILDSRF